MKVAELETGDEEALIGSLEYDAAAIGPDGSVFVATDSWAGVHEFDRTGKWNRNIGGEGHGPGEYQQVRFVSASRTGELVIYDDIGRVSIQHGSWTYTALLPDGRMTVEAEGPSGLLTAGFGYALTVSSEWLELPRLTLWRLEQTGR
ncbi:hypothetical protein ACFL6T_00680 [Candidatus Zixiibacteriota bacterium]